MTEISFSFIFFSPDSAPSLPHSHQHLLLLLLFHIKPSSSQSPTSTPQNHITPQKTASRIPKSSDDSNPRDTDTPESRSQSQSLADQFSSLNDLAHELNSLNDLATHGSWLSILDKIARARSQSHVDKPHDHLVYFTYNALALTKLRHFAEAAAEIDSLEDLNSSRYRYEDYPNIYPNQVGSMVPFSLRWLHALIPIKLGRRQEGLDYPNIYPNRVGSMVPFSLRWLHALLPIKLHAFLIWAYAYCVCHTLL